MTSAWGWSRHDAADVARRWLTTSKGTVDWERSSTQCRGSFPPARLPGDASAAAHAPHLSPTATGSRTVLP